jgi:diguanylate cyclase (GGDEF)-like protein
VALLGQSIVRAQQAGKRMKDRLLRMRRRGEISAQDYEIYRQGIERKLERSVEMKALQVQRVSERDSKFSSLFNHPTFLRKTQEILSRYPKASFIIVDIDKFKRINDELGHAVGDLALRMMANVLAQESKRLNGWAGRYGGEEFEIILPKPGPTALKFINNVNRVLLRAFANSPTLRSALQGNLFTFSAGVAEKGEGSTFGELFQIADRRVYTSKNTGRNRVSFSDSRPARRIR